MKKLEVGQIVYVLDKTNQSVQPAQIVSKNKNETLNGTFISYKALLAGTQEEFEITETNIDNIFETSKRIKSYMIAGATEFINALVDSAEELATKTFASIVQPRIDNDSQPFQPVDSTNSGKIRIRLPTGELVETDMSVDEVLSNS